MKKLLSLSLLISALLINVCIGASINNSTQCKPWVNQYGGGCCEIYCAGLILYSNQILNLGTTPVNFGLTPPTGYAIEVVNASRKLSYGTTTYATNTTLSIRTVGANVDQMAMGTPALASTITNTLLFSQSAAFAGTTNTQLIGAADIQVYVPGGNPTAGNGSVIIWVFYRLVLV